jgi:hypothetical protein
MGVLAVAALVAALVASGGCGDGGEAEPTATTGVPSTSSVSAAATTANATVPATSALSPTTSIGTSSSWVPTMPLPSVASLDELVTFLADRGVVCDHVDVENEGATAVPNGPFVIAMCYRGQGGNSLELSIYRSAQDRAGKRPDTTVLPCAQSSELRALDGLVMTIAEGGNFDIRAAESQVSTPTSLAVLNSVTEGIARQTLLRLGYLSFSCGD